MDYIKDENFIVCGGVLEGYTGVQRCVVIPNHVVIIGKKAFYRYRGLKEVIIPSCVEEIEESAFQGCDHLTSVTFHEGLVEIGESAFEGCERLTDVVFPKGLIKIGEEAFAGCVALKSICLPESLNFIGPDAFGWSGLVQISAKEPCKTFRLPLDEENFTEDGPFEETPIAREYLAAKEKEKARQKQEE